MRRSRPCIQTVPVVVRAIFYATLTVALPASCCIPCGAGSGEQRAARGLHRKPTRRGITWGVALNDTSRGIVLVSCHGKPLLESNNGSCDAYHGDTRCTEKRPILCVRPDGSPRPSYPIAGPGVSMPREYYYGWAGGRVGLTRRVRGTRLTSREAADALCAKALGKGYRMAEHHDGRWIEGMGAEAYSGESWPSGEQLSRGGWAYYASGRISAAERFWVSIDDQPANCWDAPSTHVDEW